MLEGHGEAIGMAGRGYWIDHLFVERILEHPVHQDVYLHVYEDLAVGRAGIGAHITYCSARRWQPASDRDWPTPCALAKGNAKALLALTFDAQASSGMGPLHENS